MPLSRSALAQAALAAALTGALYAIGLDHSPPHLLHDEIKFALQAHAIAETGRDLNGIPFPVYFREDGFAVGRDPLCIYLTAGVLTLLPLSEAAIRFASVLVGAAGVGLVWLLARVLGFGVLGCWFTAAILALSPTYFIHSRLALSVIYPVPFTILWLIVLGLFLHGRRRGLAYAMGLVLGTGVYSYLAAALFMPLYLVATVVVLVWAGERRAIVPVVAGFAVMMLPAVAWQFLEPDRYANILTAYRLYDPQAMSPGEKALALVSGESIALRVNTFWEAFSPEALFFTGESSLQISTREVGSLLTPVAIFLAAGIREAIRTIRTPMHALLLFGLVTAPLPAVIMADVEIRRWLVVLPFVAALAGLGLTRLLAGGPVRRATVALLAAAMVWQFSLFTADYFGAYRERASLWFGGNIRAALLTVLDDASGEAPTTVFISNEIPWVEAYWRFYTTVHDERALLERTEYVEPGEVPPASPGAVFVAPAVGQFTDDEVAAAGWTGRHIVPDLDGRPSLALLTPSR